MEDGHNGYIPLSRRKPSYNERPPRHTTQHDTHYAPEGSALHRAHHGDRQALPRRDAVIDRVLAGYEATDTQPIHPTSSFQNYQKYAFSSRHESLV